MAPNWPSFSDFLFLIYGRWTRVLGMGGKRCSSGVVISPWLPDLAVVVDVVGDGATVAIDYQSNLCRWIMTRDGWLRSDDMKLLDPITRWNLRVRRMRREAGDGDPSRRMIGS